MADKIVLLQGGKIVQIGSPDEIYERPNCKYVADFIGSPSMNFIDGEIAVVGGAPVFTAPGVAIPIAAGSRARPGHRVVLGVRPNDLAVAAGGHIHGEVILSETTGADVQLHVMIDGRDTVAVVPRSEKRAAGTLVGLTVAPENVHLFDAESEKRID